MENGAVALAAITLAGSTVVGLIWVTKYFAKTLSKDLVAHTKAAYEQIEASKEQTRASNEVLTFMKNLNGKLTDATISTSKSNKAILSTLKSSAEIASSDARNGGLLVNIKENK